MINLKSNGKLAISIEELSLSKILNIYPDESLISRKVFIRALLDKELSFSDLRKECETLCLPWQLFLLNPDKLDKELRELDELRKSKFDGQLIASRDNEGRGVSLRIADRLIALQDYAKLNVTVNNKFCGSLINLTDSQKVTRIINYFDIDPEMLNKGQKEKTLKYIIKQLEKKNIRVSRGVLNSNKLLPLSTKSVYRKSSGFVIRDEKVPYVFLPSEINDDETPGRQILTLFALLSLVGLGEYNVYIDGNFETRIRSGDLLAQTFKIANEILLPTSITDNYKGIVITEKIRDEIAEKYMLTPSAVIVTLRERGLLSSNEEFYALMESIGRRPVPQGSEHRKPPNIDTSVKKLCGEATCSDIVEGVRAGRLSQIRAQYLIFGYVDKLKFEKFKANVGL